MSVVELSSLPDYDILKIAEVASYLRISIPQAHILVNTGKLKGFKVGRLTRIMRNDLLAYVEIRQVAAGLQMP